MFIYSAMGMTVTEMKAASHQPINGHLLFQRIQIYQVHTDTILADRLYISPLSEFEISPVFQVYPPY